MEQEIRFCTTADGVRIACLAKGDGLPLVLLLPLPGHLQLDSETSQGTSDSFVRRGYRLIRFDGRGSGLSGGAANWTLEEFTLDLEAVLASFGVGKCAIFANGPSTIQAIGFAARRPERVSHLVLWEGIAAFEQVANESQMRALMGLLETDHVLFTETIANVFFGWAAGDRARSYAAALRASMTPEELRRGTRLVASQDARPFLGNVQAPTLIVHHREAAMLPMDVARELAAGIPDARLVILEGDTLASDVGAPQMHEVIDGFLLGARAVAGDVARSRADEASTEQNAGFRTILFTDVEGSTALTEQLGDVSARELLRERERVVRKELREHGGSDVKTMGDGFMASFTSATRALECAVAIQRAVEEGSASTGRSRRADGYPLRVRIGLNAGEPVAEEGDLFGTSVNLAARIAAAAKGGEILVSDVVRQLVAGKGFAFADRGAMPLKGFEDPVRLYEVRWRASPIEKLSGREREILQMIAAGMSNGEIAENLTIGLSTVKTHINNIYGKLDVTSRTKAVARARELNLT